MVLSVLDVSYSAGRLSTRFRMLARSRIALCILSSTCSLCIVAGGGCCNSFTMPLAACRMKYVIPTCGTGITFGKYSTVSFDVYMQVRGK